jgi:hypothetical protein
MDELERALIGRAAFVDAIEATQQLRARRVQIVVPVELEAAQQLQRGLDVARFRDGGRVVELHDRRAGAGTSASSGISSASARPSRIASADSSPRPP